MRDPDAVLGAVITGGIKYARIAERLRSALMLQRATLEATADITSLDPELAPEIIAAIEGVQETIEALTRAHVFASTRLEVILAAGREDTTTPTEGDPR